MKQVGWHDRLLLIVKVEWWVHGCFIKLFYFYMYLIFSIIRSFKTKNFKNGSLRSRLPAWQNIILLQINKNMGSSKVFVIMAIYSPFLPSEPFPAYDQKRLLVAFGKKVLKISTYHTFTWIDSELEWR